MSGWCSTHGGFTGDRCNGRQYDNVDCSIFEPPDRPPTHRERELMFRLDIAKGLLDDHGLMADYEQAFEEAATEARMQAMEP